MVQRSVKARVATRIGLAASVGRNTALPGAARHDSARAETAPSAHAAPSSVTSDVFLAVTLGAGAVKAARASLSAQATVVLVAAQVGATRALTTGLAASAGASAVARASGDTLLVGLTDFAASTCGPVALADTRCNASARSRARGAPRVVPSATAATRLPHVAHEAVDAQITPVRTGAAMLRTGREINTNGATPVRALGTGAAAVLDAGSAARR